LLVVPDYTRHPWRSRYAPPSAFAFATLQTQSQSDIPDPAPIPSSKTAKALGSGLRRNDKNWGVDANSGDAKTIHERLPRVP
jgi:hypothetical protein